MLQEKSKQKGGSNVNSHHGLWWEGPHTTHATCLLRNTTVWFPVWICSEIMQNHLLFGQIVPTYSLIVPPFSLKKVSELFNAKPIETVIQIPGAPEECFKFPFIKQLWVKSRSSGRTRHGLWAESREGGGSSTVLLCAWSWGGGRGWDKGVRTSQGERSMKDKWIATGRACAQLIPAQADFSFSLAEYFFLSVWPHWHSFA